MAIKEVKNLLIDTLKDMGYGAPRLQGTFAENETYPDSFITFFTIDTPDIRFYDNKTKRTAYYFDVNFYSSNPELVNTVPESIAEKLAKVGFIRQGKGSDLASDVETHTGWNTQYIYLENY